MNAFNFKKNWIPFALGILAAFLLSYAFRVAITELVKNFQYLGESNNKNLTFVGLIINNFVNLILSFGGMALLVYSGVEMARKSSPRIAILVALLVSGYFMLSYFNTMIVSIFTLASSDTAQFVDNIIAFLALFGSFASSLKMLNIADMNLEIDDEETSENDETSTEEVLDQESKEDLQENLEEDKSLE